MSVALQTRAHNTSPASIRYTVVTERLVVLDTAAGNWLHDMQCDYIRTIVNQTQEDAMTDGKESMGVTGGEVSSW